MQKGAYCLTKEIAPDPLRDTLLLRGRFQPAEQRKLRLYILMDAHIGDCGAHNEAWAGEYKGLPMVFAQRAFTCFAVACSPARQTSVGYIGTSDGFTVLRCGEPLPNANYAPDGNVAIALEIDYGTGHRLDMYRVSTAVLETHQSKRFPGGFVASLSVPWGFARGDEDIGAITWCGHATWLRVQRRG